MSTQTDQLQSWGQLVQLVYMTFMTFMYSYVPHAGCLHWTADCHRCKHVQTPAPEISLLGFSEDWERGQIKYD